jgi:hypothetical protein
MLSLMEMGIRDSLPTSPLRFGFDLCSIQKMG